MVSSSARVESSVWGTGRRKAVRAVRPCLGEQRWRVQPPSCLTSYSVVARSTECERGAGGWHGVRERLWGCGCVVRSSGRVECVGQRPAEARASCCSGVGEQGWRVDDLLSYKLLGRGEVHGV